MDETPMRDEEFRHWVIQAITGMDRQVEQLLEVQLDLARSHDEHAAKMDLMHATLDAIKDLLEQQRRN